MSPAALRTCVQREGREKLCFQVLGFRVWLSVTVTARNCRRRRHVRWDTQSEHCVVDTISTPCPKT